MQEGKKFARGYRDTTVMNILRVQLMKAFPTASFTYGNITTADRKTLHMNKGHANNAVAIAAHGLEKIRDCRETTFYLQIRKQKRSLHESIPRKGLRGTKNTEAVRRRKNTPGARGFWVNDKVTAYGGTGYISGFPGNASAYVKSPGGTYITQPGKNYKTVQLTQLKRICHNTNWYCYSLAT